MKAVVTIHSGKRIAGLQKKLLDKSFDAYVLSLETINRLSITYRVESFAYLICNAWELLLKAKILRDAAETRAIYYPQVRGQRPRTLSLRDCMNKLLKGNDPVRLNIELVEELRDAATHLVISRIPKDVLGLFQACVLNYHRHLNDWFGLSLSARVPVGMMTIVFDFQPEEADLTSHALRRRLGRETADYLTQFQARLREQYIQLGRPAEFAIDINYKLAFTKKLDDADIVIASSPVGAPARIVEVPKDPAKTHPYRRKDLVAHLNAVLRPDRPINVFDIQCVVEVYRVKKNPAYFYQGRVEGSPMQYGEEFADWLAGEYRRDRSFFSKVRDKARARGSHSDPTGERGTGRMRSTDVRDADDWHPSSDVMPSAASMPATASRA